MKIGTVTARRAGRDAFPKRPIRVDGSCARVNCHAAGRLGKPPYPARDFFSRTPRGWNGYRERGEDRWADGEPAAGKTAAVVAERMVTVPVPEK